MANPSQFLLQLLQTAPRSSALALADQSITQAQFQDLLPLMTQFTHLQEVDLSNNEIIDITGIDQLQQLARLDVGGNPLPARSFLHLFSSLPLLRHLTVPFATVGDEMSFVTHLPQLSTLNGHALVNGPNGVRVLSKSGRPTTVPASAAAPAGVATATAAPAAPAAVDPVAAPESTSSPAPDINLVGADLEPVATLFDSIRRLLPAASLAASSPTDEPFVQRRHADCRLDTFESHINTTVVALNASLAEPPCSTSPIMRNAAILRAKQTLFEVCAAALMSHARVLQPEMAECITTLRSAESAVQRQYTDLLTWLDREFDSLTIRARLADEQVNQAREATRRAEAEKARPDSSTAKLSQRLEAERESAVKEKKALVTLVETLDAEVAQHRAAAQAAQESEAALRKQFEAREAYWMERDAAWQARSKGLQVGNPSLPAPTPAPQRPSIGGGASGVPPNSAQSASHQTPMQTPHQQPHPSSGATDLAQAFFPSHHSISAGGPSPLSSTFSDAGDASSVRSHNANTPFTTGNAALYTPAIPSQHFHPSTTSQALTLQQAAAGATSVGPNPAAAMTTGRTMTLRQIKDLIREIYLSFDLMSKSLIDSHNARQESQKETLLQHMYTFLNHKFGLKSLILDAANSLIRGLQQYANDHTVAVFGGILRHTLDEEFRHTEEKTKKSVRELLKVYLQSKNPLKRDGAIQALAEKRIKSTLSEEEYTDIVAYMFAPEDCLPITSTIRSLVMQQRAQEEQQHQKASLQVRMQLAQAPPVHGGKMAIKYTTFVNILLDFQLHVHRKYLEPFVQVFRLFDPLHSGLLSYDQFYQLVQLLNRSLSDQAIRTLIGKADPFHHQLISFSDCVAVLGEELKQLAIKHHRQQQQQQHQQGGTAANVGPAAADYEDHPIPADAHYADNAAAFTTPAPQPHFTVHDAPPSVSVQSAQRQPFRVHGS